MVRNQDIYQLTVGRRQLAVDSAQFFILISFKRHYGLRRTIGEGRLALVDAYQRTSVRSAERLPGAFNGA